MFERFTNDAKRAVVAAQEEARGARRAAIEYDDVVVGVLAQPRNVGAWLLAELGVDVGAVLVEIRAGRPTGTATVQGHLPFTAAAKDELDQLPYAAALLRDEHLGTEHLILVTLTVGRSLGARLLVQAGADAPRYRAAIEAHAGRLRSGAIHAEAPHLYRAVEHLRASDGANALTEADLALADAARSGQQPMLAHAQNLVAWIISLGMVEGRYPEALALVEQALAQLPDEVGIAGTRLAVLSVMGRGAETIAGHERILALGDEVLGEKRGVSHSFLARALLDVGDLRAARSHLEEADRLATTWPIHTDTWRRLRDLEER